MTLSPVYCALMSIVLIHLKDGAKTAPLHSALPANPRHWLGADSKAAHVGLCATRPQVTCSDIDGKKKAHQRHERHSFSSRTRSPAAFCCYVCYRPSGEPSSSSSAPLCFSSIWTVEQTADWACCLVLHAHLIFASFFFEPAALQSSSKLVFLFFFNEHFMTDWLSPEACCRSFLLDLALNSAATPGVLACAG